MHNPDMVVRSAGAKLAPGRIGDIAATGRLRRLFWRVADDLDYLWTLATLRILDALAGPLPETPADPEANIVADGLQQRALPGR